VKWQAAADFRLLFVVFSVEAVATEACAVTPIEVMLYCKNRAETGLTRSPNANGRAPHVAAGCPGNTESGLRSRFSWHGICRHGNDWWLERILALSSQQVIMHPAANITPLAAVAETRSK
jgi:hypothetical protein